MSAWMIADGQPQILERRTHPGGVAADQIIVHRHDMAVMPLQNAHEARQRRDERLALAGGHFGDLAFVQHQPADDLHVETPARNGGRLSGYISRIAS